MIFVMVKCSVLFEVRNGFLNAIWTSFGFKGLIVKWEEAETEARSV
jgi:hypothetical protein